MKILLSTILILFSFSNVSFAESVSIDDLAGDYVLTVAETESDLYVHLKINEDGSYIYRETDSPELAADAPQGCVGSYIYKESIFHGKLDCSDSEDLMRPGSELIKQSIDFTEATLEELYSETGSTVKVASAQIKLVTGEESLGFVAIKVMPEE